MASSDRCAALSERKYNIAGPKCANKIRPCMATHMQKDSVFVHTWEPIMVEEI